MTPLARAAASAGLALAVLPAASAGQVTVLESGGVSLGLSGYVRSLTGFHDQGFDLPGSIRRTGFHGEVVRLKWKLGGEGWTLDVHDRFQARVASASSGTRVVGFGVSVLPDRLVDLSTTLLDEEGLTAWHDIDRLSLTVLTGAVDVTVGRQAITWGVSALFPVADLWAQFSPFELDTEEKPGIDAVRALFYPVAGLEMDAVVADRGSIEELSAGLRGTLGLARADVWAGAGKFWREAIAMGGITFLLDQARLRAEAAFPWDLDGGGAQDPRATGGVDWIRGTWTLAAEYHFNGIGVGDPGRYLAQIADPRFVRGESYYLGRHYLGALAVWSPDDENRLSLALNGLANLGDGSIALTPVVSYDVGQATSLSIGGLVSFGAAPTVAPPTGLRSEFGTYGDLVFTRLSVYF